MKQCEATSRASTYSEAHRCLKETGATKIGKRYLCSHHKNAKIRAARSVAPKRSGREQALHIAEFMEFEKLKKLHGRALKVEPCPLTRTGRLLVKTQHNKWKITLSSSRLVVLTRAATAHQLAVKVERILSFQPPDRLILDGQLILEGAKVSLVPHLSKHDRDASAL